MYHLHNQHVPLIFGIIHFMYGYLKFIGRIKWNFTNFGILCPVSNYVPILVFHAFQYSSFRGIPLYNSEKKYLNQVMCHYHIYICVVLQMHLSFMGISSCPGLKTALEQSAATFPRAANPGSSLSKDAPILLSLVSDR